VGRGAKRRGRKKDGEEAGKGNWAKVGLPGTAMQLALDGEVRY